MSILKIITLFHKNKKFTNNKSMKIRIFRLILLFVFTATLLSFKPTYNHFASAQNSSQALMSIVIDDFGSYDQSGVELLLSSNIPLTCAVIPNVDNTQNNINKILNTNCELILHMPMQAHVNLPKEWYGPVYITNYDSPEIACKKITR